VAARSSSSSATCATRAGRRAQPWLRGRVPRGGDRLGPYSSSTRSRPRRQHRGHPERPASGTDAGVRRVVFACSRRCTARSRSSQARDDAAAPCAVRRREITGAVPVLLEPPVRRRDGVLAVLQRVRTAAGPELAYSGVISIFVDRISGAPITIFATRAVPGFRVRGQRRRREHRGAPDRTSRRAYNVGCGQKTSLNQLAAMLGRIAVATCAPRTRARAATSGSPWRHLARPDELGYERRSASRRAPPPRGVGPEGHLNRRRPGDARRSIRGARAPDIRVVGRDPARPGRDGLSSEPDAV